ncbi:DUF4917 family protein [Pseudomonas sp. GD03842]|uniref:DUF4917 family protein n=1 Tax=unclassified Pseudomonas TaxID=196821 RepID=UPI000D3A2C73|nr:MULTISPECIES: DUF4917 family protein [unclassified Pseudomonas]MDH0748518.1 DUF4917 family protein [Pseudomonas sp. GD03842]RAU43230.1 DUF4917 family protein [Pseudomonas sp. RIT 409]RAU50274.1 DUF4917 family protein [Pseudomonas sp. RIT 412]
MDFTDFDAELSDWAQLQNTHPCTGLLLGNGASRAVWKHFAYDSLFELAQTTRNKPLSPTELALFKSMDTENFEPVLSGLKIAMRVNAALTISSSSPRNRYFAIKEALIHGIRSAHIPWRLMEPSTIAHISQALSQYETVYSTNYDLLAYWAVMHGAHPFDDLFDDDATFNLHRTDSHATRVLYLHGGMHLVKHFDGTTRKLLSSESTLLGSFAVNALEDVPLFVCEGRSDDKMKIIRGSDYLAYCHAQLARHQGALCIFGHALGRQDRHILDAVLQARPQTLAISILPRNDAFVQHQKRHYHALFEGQHIELQFFNALTHPLGNPRLSVPVTRAGDGVEAKGSQS